MSTEFGTQVLQKAAELARQGIDPNQAAKALFDQDPQGRNYGIGIILGGNGKPYTTSPTLLHHVRQELERCNAGSYMNSDAMNAPLKEAVLRWQRIPEDLWGQFDLALPSDAGTGAVKTAVEAAFMLHPDKTALGVEELGWPAYRAIARTTRLAFEVFPLEGIIANEDVIPLYQAGPLNTTGLVQKEDTVRARAEAAAANGDIVILDRAYSGFEFAQRLDSVTYDEVMTLSYERQVRPFVEAGVPFALAISPTKAFVTFSLRPAGILLVFSPEPSRKKAVSNALVTTVRARGSSFEHPITRAFVRAMIEDRERLEDEHEAAMRRVSAAEKLWESYARATPIEYLFSDHYAGLFRNPKARTDAGMHLYNEHLYPVLSEERCRLNVTGIPEDEELARKHVAAFAAQCY